MIHTPYFIPWAIGFIICFLVMLFYQQRETNLALSSFLLIFAASTLWPIAGSIFIIEWFAKRREDEKYNYMSDIHEVLGTEQEGNDITLVGSQVEPEIGDKK